MEQLFKIAIVLQAIDQATRPIQNISKATKELERSVEQTASKFDKFKEKLSQLNEKVKSLESVASTAAFGIATKSMLTAFMELEDAQKRLQATMMEAGGRIPEIFQKINEEAGRLGAELPGTTRDFYQLAATMLQLGVSAEALAKGGLRAAAYLASVLKIPYEEAGMNVAKYMEALGIAQEELLQFIDIIQRVAHLGVTPTEMRYAFAKLSGTLKLLGWQGLESAKQLTPLVARMIQLGYSGETVGTNLSAVFSSLLNPKKVQEFTKELEKFGIQLQLLDEQGRVKAPAEIIAEFSKISEAYKQGLISQQELYTILSKLTGASGEDLKMLTAIITEGAEGYNKMNEAMSRQADLQKRIQLISSSLSSAWEALTGTFTNLLTTLGAQLAPALKTIANFLNDLIDKTTQFFEKHQTLAKVIAWSIAGFAALSATMLALAGTIMIISAPFKMLFALFSTLVPLAKGVVAILRLLGPAIQLLLSLLTKFAPVLNAIAVALRFLFLSTPLGWILLVVGGLAYLAWRFGILQKAIEIAGKAFKWLWSIVSSVISNIKEYISTRWRELLKLLLTINPIFAPMFALQKFVSFVRSINLFDAGQKIINSLVEGLKSAANKPVEVFRNIAQRIRNFLPFSPAREGPLRDIHLTGLKLVQTIAASITPAPLVSAMSRTLAQAVALPSVAPLSAGPGSSPAMLPSAPRTAPNIVINLGGITINGKITPAEAQQTASMIEEQIRRVLEKIERDKWRRQF